MKRGEIYWATYEYDYEGKHHKMQRPAIIVSNDKTNTYDDKVEIVYLTTKINKEFKRPIITSSNEVSAAMTEQIHTIGKEMLGFFIGEVTEGEMLKLELAMAESLNIALMPGTREPETIEVEVNNPQLEAELETMKKEVAAAKREAEIFKDLYQHLLQKMVG